MKKQNSDKKLTKLGDYLKCHFFKSTNRAYNRFKSINNYKNKNVEILIRKIKNKTQNKTKNIFELINFEELLLNNYKKKKEDAKIIMGKDGKSKYINENVLLGRGGFGQCYKFRCIDKDDKNYYAGKIIKKEKVRNNKKSLLDEINIQKQFNNNPKVVKVKDYFEDDENVYIILELCKKKSLADYLLARGGRLKEIEVKCFIFQLLQGLKCLHKEKIIHRDLKPNNLLLDDKYELKIGDFGLVVKITQDKEGIKDICGTYSYMAPEIYKNNEKGYSFEVDIWAVGIIIYQLLTGKLIFNGENKDEIEKKILSFQPEYLDVSGLSDVAADLIKQILVIEPKMRPGISQILYHYFFHDTEFPKYITPEFLKKIDKKEKEKEKNTEENKEKNNKNLNVKLYNLIVEYIPEIEYENIKNYVIKKSVSAYENYITYFHPSSHYSICYYEFNNEIIGVIDKYIQKNKEKKSFEINMIYNTETKIFSIIKIDEDNEYNDIIERYTEEEIPEKQKKVKDLLLYYYNLSQKKKKNIEVKDESLSIKEENSFSQSTQKSEENSLSNKNLIISEQRAIDKTNFLYVRRLLIKQKVSILFFSDQTIESIFTDKIKILMSELNSKIQIIDQNNQIIVISAMNSLQNDNHDFTSRLKMVKKTIYNDVTSMISEKKKETNQSQGTNAS